jgi:hypothetical protein
MELKMQHLIQKHFIKMGDIPSHYLRQLENKINKFYSVLQ